MNICIIGQYPPQVGGIATYSKELRDNLTKKGHNVYILTYPSTIQQPEYVYETYTPNLKGFRGLSFIVSGYRILNKLIKEKNIDIIHAQYILPPGFLAILQKHKGIKIVITAHGSDINLLPKNKILKRIIKYTLNKSDNIYFVSDELKNKANSLHIPHLNEKSTITPNTVNVNKFKPLDSSKKSLLKMKYKNTIIIFIGNLVKQKGLIYLLEAKLKTKSNYTLLIYGEGPEKNNLKEFIEKNNLKDVYLMGKTNSPEIIIPQADIIVLPSISEGASIVALESLAAGIPLIASNVGNIKDVIQDHETGIIIPIKDSISLSKAIDEVVLNKKLQEKIRKKARKDIVKKYSVMKIPYIELE